MMLVKGLRAAHLVVRVAWLAGTAVLLALILVPAALPALGHPVFVVRGASMEPAIPLGAVVIDHPVEPQTVQVGQIVTYRLPQGTVVTHRVTAITTDSGLAFATKGDASAAADPSTIPADEILGTVEYTVPLAGYLIYTIGSPPGTFLAIGILGMLLLVGWSLERLTRILSNAPPGRPRARMGAVR